MQPEVKSFFHHGTWTITHVICDPKSVSCAIVDPVRDFDHKSCRTGTMAADEVIAWVRERGLQVEWILETHAHADHLTAAPYLKEQLDGKIGIGAGIVEVQKIFKAFFNAEPDFATDGSQFDHLFEDDETFLIGEMTAKAWHTPGHTPACTTYVVGISAFVGDTIFMPDSGSARADFPGGDAATLYRSIKRVLALPPATSLYMCHDYGPKGRDFAWITTVAEERGENPHVRDGISQTEFVRLRTERDENLDVPNLLLASVQVNMRAGRFPPPESNDVSYLKLPLNSL
jgi:glyoxylase-like metal-dependent hydrolase (beta-lactamase superfamily II)